MTLPSSATLATIALYLAAGHFLLDAASAASPSNDVLRHAERGQFFGWQEAAAFWVVRGGVLLIWPALLGVAVGYQLLLHLVSLPSR